MSLPSCYAHSHVDTNVAVVGLHGPPITQSWQTPSLWNGAESNGPRRRPASWPPPSADHHTRHAAVERPRASERRRLENRSRWEGEEAQKIDSQRSFIPDDHHHGRYDDRSQAL